MIKKALLTLFLPTAILFGLVLRPETKSSKPFCLGAICSPLPSLQKWTCRELSEEERSQVSEALSQSYNYLGSGGQCYAFSSEDDKYVIKFFKQKSFALPKWMERFPLPFLIAPLKKAKLKKKEHQRSKVFSAFKLSLDQLPQETGMLFVHLNRTTDLGKTLCFCDAEGKQHWLHLDDLEFVVQKKAEMAFARIDTLMQSGNVSAAKEAVFKLLQFHESLHRKGFRNRDPNFRSNCGFIDNEPVLIDVGRMVYCEEMKKASERKKQWEKALPRLQKYLSVKHPELLPYMESCVEYIYE